MSTVEHATLVYSTLDSGLAITCPPVRELMTSHDIAWRGSSALPDSFFVGEKHDGLRFCPAVI